jgi:hypothetical protein
MRSDDFETVLDVDGRPKRILRDHHVVRVPLMLRDGVNPSLTALQRSVADRAVRRKTTYDPKGRLLETSEEEEETDDRGTVRDASNTPFGLHKPGYRRLANDADHAALIDAKARAYRRYDAEIGRAYLTPEGFGGDPRITGAGSHGQRQQPLAGSPCTRNGFRGVWRRDDDGQMVCDITAAAGRADATARRARPDPDEDEDDDDRRSVAQAASDHQQRMAQIYDALDQELAEAWRKP